jgi:hypothetical protein
LLHINVKFTMGKLKSSLQNSERYFRIENEILQTMHPNPLCVIVQIKLISALPNNDIYARLKIRGRD